MMLSKSAIYLILPPSMQKMTDPEMLINQAYRVAHLKGVNWRLL